MKAHVQTSQPKPNLLFIILLLAAFIGIGERSWGQGAPIIITTPNTPVTQDFNTLANTGTANNRTIALFTSQGWNFNERNPPGGSGVANTYPYDNKYGADNGSATTNDTYSYGSTGSTDRALGMFEGANLGSVLGFKFQNNTNATVTSITIGYTGEEWRTANTADVLTFQYYPNSGDINTDTYPWVSVPALNFTTPVTGTPTALNGNLAANRTVIGPITFTIPNGGIPTGATYTLRWIDNTYANSAGMGIDDFTITLNVVKQDQTITFPAFAAKTTSDTLFTTGAAASSALALSYTSSNPSVATVSSTKDTVQIRGVGTTVITASQAGDAAYNAATPVSQTLTVTRGTDLLAGWDFQTTTNGGTPVLAMPITPKVYTANTGSGTIYLNGTNGSSNWMATTNEGTNELNGYAGTAYNAITPFTTVTTGAASLALTNNTANGKSVIFKFDMSTHKNLVVSYATQGTGTGFSTQKWEYSTSSSGPWALVQNITNIPLSFITVALPVITGLDLSANAYLRLTVTGATGNLGNNRLDNIRLNAGVAPAFTTSPSDVSICAGTTSTSTFTAAASGAPSPTYQWQYSATGAAGSFANVADGTPTGFTYSTSATATTTPTTSTLTVTTPASAAPGSYYYRAVATNASGAVNSAGATLTINPLPVATVTANNAYACQGNGGSFTITGTANSTVSYNLDGGPSQSVTLTSGSASVPLGTIFSSTTITLTSVSASVTNCTSTPSGAGSTATITAAPLPTAYTVTGGGFYCQGGMGVVVGLSNSDAGVNYQLLFYNGSTTVAAGSPMAGNTGNPISFGNQTGIGTYTVRATNAATGCQITGTSSVTVNYYTPTSISSGPAPASQTVCQNSTPTDLDVTAVGGGTLNYQWFSNTANNNTGGTSVTTATTQHSYTPSAAVQGTLYYYVIVTGACGTVTSSTVSVTVDPTSVAGTISGAGAVCTGTNSTILTLSGNTGLIQWQSSTDNSTFTNISSATGQTYTATNLTTTTYYRAVVTSGSCSSATTASVTITVNPASVAGTITGGGGNVCTGTNSTTLTLNSYVGIIQWQSSTDNSTFTNISGATAATYTATNLTTTTYYKAVVTSGSCSSAMTASVTVTVNPNASVGSVTGTSPLCIGATATYTANAVVLGGSGTGAWSSSNTSVATVNSASGVVTAKAAGTTIIIYTVTGGCGGTPSAQQTLTVSPNANAGTVSGTTPLCSGSTATYSSNGDASGAWSSTNTAVATVNASSGLVTAMGAGTTDITYTVSTGCNAPVSSFQTLTVNQTPTASFASATYSSCEGTGADVTFTGTPNTTITYTITIQGGTPVAQPPVIIDASGDNQIRVSPTGVGVYTYTITSVTNGTGCTATIMTGTTTVTINPQPVVADIMGPDYIALTKTGIYTDGTPGGIWAITNDPTGSASVASQSGNPATATVQASTSNVGTPMLTYTVTTNGCSTTFSKTIQVFDNTIARYRSVQDGRASDNTTWEFLGNNGWINPAPSAPDDNSNIEVRHNVTVEVVNFDGTPQSSFTITSHDQSGTTVDGTLTIFPTHYFQSKGSVNFNDKSVTLLSDQTGTAAIGEMISPIANATNVTVHRFTDAKKYINANGSRRAWRLITSPVTGQMIHESWQENGNNTNGYGTLITGEGFSDATTAGMQGYDWIGSGNHTSIKHYVSATDTWLPLSTGTAVSLQTEPAYMLFVRGNRNVGATGTTPATLRSTGTLQQGTQSNVAIQANVAYTLVGNPYASAIDFGKFILHNPNLKDQFYSWNSTIGSYGAYVLIKHDGTGTNQGGYEATPSTMSGVTGPRNQDEYKYIPNGSGFFVSPATPSSTGTISFEEGDKAPGQVPPINPFRVIPDATNVRQLLVNLNLKDSDTSATLADGFRAKFSPDYEGNEEDNSSAKVYNFNENLNLVRGGKAHIIEARGEVSKTDTLYMKMWYVTKRNYQLQMQADNFGSAPGIQAWLLDNYSGTKQEISLTGDITTVNFAVTSDSLSWKSDRFMIVFQNNSAVLPVTLTNVKAILQNGGVNVSWTVSNEVNMKSYTVERSTDGGRTYTAVATQAAKNITGAIVTSYAALDAQPKTGDNLYRIRIEAKDGGVTYSSVVSVSIDATGNIEIAVYPNPVREGKVSLQLTNLAAGTYLVSVYTSGGGQTVYQKKISITQSGTTQSEQLILGSSIAQGSYQLRIADHTGTVIKETQLVVGR